MSSSFAGGTVATLMSYILIDGKFEVTITINGILGSLVAISAGMRVAGFSLCLINPILKIY
jgi:ammonia channel protein AmtB